MATSTKVMFTKDTLQAMALAAVDAQIQECDAALTGMRGPTEEDVAAWRARQIDRVWEAVGADVETLAAFKIEPMPAVREFDRERVQRRRAQLVAERNQIMAKSEALVADENGQIALTKTQLKEFFGL